MDRKWINKTNQRTQNKRDKQQKIHSIFKIKYQYRILYKIYVNNSKKEENVWKIWTEK